jgi:hypothetical protein
LEDDAQNGPDHVDAHRSTCYVISPWIKAGAVDHSFQNTVSALRTIESLLNLPPMCQYDAASGVIGGWDRAPANAAPFTAIVPPASILEERGVQGGATQPAAPSPETLRPGASKNSYLAGRPKPPLKTPEDLAAASEEMDFTVSDQAPAELLNEIIWKTVRGPASEMPPTPHVPTAGARSEADRD